MTDTIIKKNKKHCCDLSNLERIYNTNYERIYRYCCKRLFSRTAAEDVTASVFLAVAKNKNTFNGQTDQQMKNWLYKIASNQANSYLRKKKRRQNILKEVFKIAQSSQTDTPDTGCTSSEWPSLYQAITKLKTSEQTLITLRFFESLDYEQIAQIMETRPETLRVRCHRALKKLKKLMHSSSMEI